MHRVEGAEVCWCKRLIFDRLTCEAGFTPQRAAIAGDGMVVGGGKELPGAVLAVGPRCRVMGRWLLCGSPPVLGVEEGSRSGRGAGMVGMARPGSVRSRLERGEGWCLGCCGRVHAVGSRCR